MDSEYIICAQCKKRVAVLHKDIWAYKKRLAGKTMRYFCSWKCLREDEKKGTVNMARKLTLEQKKKAVQISIDGGDPIEFLRECGCDAPDKTWWYIKNKLKDSNPELYAKIPDGRKRNGKNVTKKLIKEGEQRAAANPDPEKAKPDEEIREIEIPIVEILTARYGCYTFENLGGGILIRNDERGQALTVEEEYIEQLAKALPMVKEIFRE